MSEVDLIQVCHNVHKSNEVVSTVLAKNVTMLKALSSVFIKQLTSNILQYSFVADRQKVSLQYFSSTMLFGVQLWPKAFGHLELTQGLELKLSIRREGQLSRVSIL